MGDADQSDIALARVIMHDATLRYFVDVAAGMVPVTTAARRRVVDAIAGLERDGHPAARAMRLAVCTARVGIAGVLLP